MSGDKTRRETENKQKPQVSLLWTSAQEPCLLQIKVNDERQSIYLKKSARSMREAERSQQDTLMWDEGTQRDRKVAAKETSKPLSLCRLKWLSLESTGPETGS